MICRGWRSAIPLFTFYNNNSVIPDLGLNCLQRLTADHINQVVNIIIEPVHEISNSVECATSKASDQPAHTLSLIRAFASRLIVKLLTEHHLEFLSLKGVCRGPSESTHVKMPLRWKSHVLAHIFISGSTPVFDWLFICELQVVMGASLFIDRKPRPQHRDCCILGGVYSNITVSSRKIRYVELTLNVYNLVLLNSDLSYFENTVDQDQLASEGFGFKPHWSYCVVSLRLEQDTFVLVEIRKLIFWYALLTAWVQIGHALKVICFHRLLVKNTLTLKNLLKP